MAIPTSEDRHSEKLFPVSGSRSSGRGAPTSDGRYSGKAVVALISSIDSRAVTLCTFTSEISA